MRKGITWAQYNETVYMRQAADGSYTSPVPTELPALDYIVPRGVRIARNEDATAIRRIWFEASPELLELADQAATVFVDAVYCLTDAPSAK